MFEHVTAHALTTFICLVECCIPHAEQELSKAHQHVQLCSIIMMPVQVTIQLILLIAHCAGGKSGDCNNLDLSDDKEVSTCTQKLDQQQWVATSVTVKG